MPTPTTRMPGPQGEAAELVLGRYRVLERRGEGGFGQVYVCWDPRLTRRVAIKVIPLRRPDAPGADEEARSEGMMRGALREARAASMLAHPNIVTVYEFAADADNAYIIMEYVEGASLAELLDATQDGLLTPDEAAAVAEGVGDALAYAHANGILHLDIKPDNILIDPTGRVRLADFGMATLSTATGFGSAVGGTVGYMPPEQIQGARPDVRTDVFAFAAVMYEALTGTRPFAAPTPAASLERICQTLDDPCALNEDVPPALADALLWGLEADPDERPESAQELTEAMAAGLGSARAGRRSLAEFVADVLDDERPDEASPEGAQAPDPAELGPYGEELGPLTLRFPHLLPRALTALAALGGGAVAGLAASSWTGGLATTPVAVSAVAVGVVGAAAPQLAGPLAAAAVAAALLASPAHLWWLALAVLACAAAWWLASARTSPLASGTPMAGCACLHAASPAPALLGGLLLPPGQAALAAALTAALAVATCALAGQGTLGTFAPGALAGAGGARVAAAAVTLVASPATWVRAAGWVGAAAALSAFAANGGRARCYLGCCCAGLICSLAGALACGVENGGSWLAISPEVLVGPAASTILVCLIIGLFGTPRSFLVREDDAA